MTVPTPDPAPADPPPADDPDKAELARLRQEAADRRKADDDAKDAELAKLRQEAADRAERDRKSPKPPAVKPADPPATPPALSEPKKRARVSRTWFGSAADDD